MISVTSNTSKPVLRTIRSLPKGSYFTIWEVKDYWFGIKTGEVGSPGHIVFSLNDKNPSFFEDHDDCVREDECAILLPPEKVDINIKFSI